MRHVVVLLFLLALVTAAPQLTDTGIGEKSIKTVPYIVEGPPPDDGVVERIVRTMEEKNLDTYREDSYVATREGNIIRIRHGENPPADVPKQYGALFPLEVNYEELLRKGKSVVKQVVGKKYVLSIVEKKDSILLGKRVVFDSERNVSEVNLYVEANVEGVYYVEENVPKGEELELNIKGPYIIIDFDPVIAWIVRLGEGNAAILSYTVRSSVPPETEPTISRLASCDVDVEVLRVERIGSTISGELRVLLSGVPVYTPSLRVNGEAVFLREKMVYLFEAEGDTVIVEGRVGECPFYKEIHIPTSSTGLLLVAAVPLLVILYLLLRH